MCHNSVDFFNVKDPNELLDAATPVRGSDEATREQHLKLDAMILPTFSSNATEAL